MLLDYIYSSFTYQYSTDMASLAATYSTQSQSPSTSDGAKGTDGATGAASIDVSSPIVWLQDPANKADVLACAWCGSAKVGDQVRHLAERFGCSSAGERNTRISSTSTDLYECELGCGVKYCSETCRDRDAMSGHAKLCVGPHTDFHPLYRYIVLALESGDAYPEFMMAARLSVLACQGSSPQTNPASPSARAAAKTLPSEISLRVAQAAAFWHKIVHDESIPVWWKLVSSEMVDIEVAEYVEAAEAMVKEAWELLQRGVDMTGGYKFYSSFHYGDFGRILTFLSREKSRLSLASALESQITAMSAIAESEWDSDTVLEYTTLAKTIAKVHLAEEMEVISGMKAASLDEEGGQPLKEGDFDSEWGSDNNESSANIQRWQAFISASPTKAMRMIVAEPRQYLTTPCVVICLPSPGVLSIPHSCMPTCRLEGEIHHIDPHSNSGNSESSGKGLVLRLVPISVGDGNMSSPAAQNRKKRTATLSKIENVGMSDLSERVDLLALCGILCKCNRCTYEQILEGECVESAASLGTQELIQLALVAQDQERYQDANALWTEIIEKTNPGTKEQGNALYHRARVAGWRDRWSEADRLFVEAGKLAPNNAKIKSWLLESHSYATLSKECSALEPSSPTATVSATSFLDGRAFLTKGVMTLEECSLTIQDVEQHVRASSAGGWTTSRHYAVPTTDIPVHSVPPVLKRFNNILMERIFPLLARQFKVEASSIRVIDAFVVKYSAERQRSLPLHCDQSQFSLTITLNSGEEYEGGGTYFAETGDILNSSEPGAVISFEGALLHGGHPITRGTRYIIVAFLYAYED